MSDTQLRAVHAKLKSLRERKDLKLRPTKHLKSTFTDFDGQEKPLKVRYYQVQGILHLILMRRFVLGDDTGLGKTLEVIASLCHIWEKDPNRKVIVLTTKSAAPQWFNEFAKFTMGVKAILCKGSPKQREKAHKMWLTSDGPTVIIMGYRSAVQDISKLQNWSDYVFVCDEATVFKNPKTQVHQVCAHMASQSSRTWGLTATLIKNHLMEGYGIYQVVMPGLFGMTKNQFMLYYCLTRMQRLPKGNRQIPVIIGYAPQKIKEFKKIIDPYFIGRPKHEVASELPTLTRRTITVEMSREQQDKYEEALSGLLEMGIDEDTGEAVVKEVTKLTAIAYCQEIVNDLALIDCDGKSAKKDALLDLLTEGDFAEENVIVFTRFRKMVDILMPLLAKNKIKAVRITGSENEDQRAEAMKAFQDPNSDVRVCCITTAASESINLQMAKALVCYDTPWSAGDFLQLIGRMIRIGSIHDKCYVIHLLARGKKKRSIDHRVMEVLGKKMDLVEAVLGKRIKSDSDEVNVDADNDISDLMVEVANDISLLFDGLREDAREI